MAIKCFLNTLRIQSCPFSLCQQFFFWIPDAAPEGLQIRCFIFQRKREQRPRHVQLWKRRVLYFAIGAMRVPCVLQIRAGIMELTCNSALSAIHRTQFLKTPRNVRHTDGDFATRAFRNTRPMSHIYEISLPSVSATTAGAPSQQPLAS